MPRHRLEVTTTERRRRVYTRALAGALLVGSAISLVKVYDPHSDDAKRCEVQQFSPSTDDNQVQKQYEVSVYCSHESNTYELTNTVRNFMVVEADNTELQIPNGNRSWQIFCSTTGKAVLTNNYSVDCQLQFIPEGNLVTI